MLAQPQNVQIANIIISQKNKTSSPDITKINIILDFKTFLYMKLKSTRVVRQQFKENDWKAVDVKRRNQCFPCFRMTSKIKLFDSIFIQHTFMAFSQSHILQVLPWVLYAKITIKMKCTEKDSENVPKFSERLASNGDILRRSSCNLPPMSRILPPS